VTKKIAYVYRENGQLSLAANEYERIERESQDQEVRKEALLIAAELHEEAGNKPGRWRCTGATWTTSPNRWSSTWKHATRLPKC
jgi:hypothetical protein